MKNKTIIPMVFVILYLFFTGCAQNYKGPVTKEQAIRIAERTALKEHRIDLKHFKPYKVELLNGRWIIGGAANNNKIKNQAHVPIVRIVVNESTGVVEDVFSCR